MRRFIVLVGLTLAIAALPLAAFAQTPVPTDAPTPAPTVTPPTWESHTLGEGGHTYIIDRTATYGDIFVALAVFVLTAVFVLRWLYDFANRWML